MPLTPEMSELLDRASQRAVEEIHTGAIGKVVKYTAATQTVDVEVVWNPPIPDAADQPVAFEKLPVLPDVPVAFPRAQGFIFSVPLAAGDHVILVFMERSIAGWRNTGNVENAEDTRLHSTSYPIAIPGVVSDTAAAAMIDKTFTGTGMLIGKDNDQAQIRITAGSIQLGKTGGDNVALASLVKACLDTLKGHTHAAGSLVANTSTGVITGISGAAAGSINTDVKSTLIKAQ